MLWLELVNQYMGKYYKKFLDCNHRDENMQIIMRYLFSEEKQKGNENIENIIKTFNNPAIKKMFEIVSL